MAPNHHGFFLPLLLALAAAADLPTLYEYYTSDGISSGLSVDQPYFTLNGKNISIYSGAIHYFRVPPQYWQDRLRKLRASGLNTLETYVAWNLHEPQSGVFDFGDGGSDFEQFLDLEKYLQLAQEEDLFVIIRPGPYICGEWEWGGLPSWLLREDVKIRSADETYYGYVKRFFDKLLPILAKYQFSRGGPIIAFQVENEYGNSPYKQQAHVQQLYDLLIDNDIEELIFTGDNARAGTSGTVPGLIFQTLTSTNPLTDLATIEKLQPGKPLLAIEYYPGWFDGWGQQHQTRTTDAFRETFEGMITYPASVNLYMFHGGTNWGFLNGGLIPTGPDNSGFQPTTTSYDYDAPVSEAGDYSEKYDVIRELMDQYNTVKTKIPDPPELVERQPYPTITIDSYLTLEDVINQAPESITSDTPLPMEKLPINNNSGQSYGYIVYRQESIDIPANSVLTITDNIRDTLLLLINGELVSEILTGRGDLDDFGFWRATNSSITLTSEDLKGVTLDIVIENWGRGNVGTMATQHKGLIDDNHVLLNDQELTSWTIYPLEFKKSWNTQLTGWKSVESELEKGPGLYKATLTIDDSVNYDNFLDMQEWNKGLVIVNGFVLGKYAFIGPQQTLYLPRPLLQNGDNEIIIFEHYEPISEIKFSKDAIYHR